MNEGEIELIKFGGIALNTAGVLLTAYVALKMRTVVHQTNGMHKELRRMAKAEGVSEEKERQRVEDKS